MWVYHSPIGAMVISQQENGRYYLLLNDERYGSWHSPDAAADDVYHHVTGCFDWDSMDGQVDAPADLSGWEPL